MPRQPRSPLSRERILETALAVADRAGGRAVTMRGIARQLGVEAMSLYHHVRDREDLLDGLAETMVRSGLPAPPPGTPAREILTGFARGIRATALAHPDAFQLVGLRPLRRPEALGAVTTLLSSLDAAGMDVDLAVTAYRVTVAYARGFALSEIAGLTLGPGVDTPLPPDLTPYAAVLAQDTEAMFESGLAVIIAGLESKGPAPGDWV